MDASRSAGVAVIAVAVALFLALVCSADAVTLPGSPLSVSVGPLGECQSSYENMANNFFPEEGPLGDCGFFLGFPAAGNPKPLQETVYGFKGFQGPGLSEQYAPLDQGTPTGSGSAADPYRLITEFIVGNAEAVKKNDYALITETTTYVEGEQQFTSTFDVENVTGQDVAGLSTAAAATLRFHAIYAGDLATGGSDFGTGFLRGGEGGPRFIGGQNDSFGVLAGLIEAAPPSPPWSDYETGCWNSVPEPLGRCESSSPADVGVWHAVRSASAAGPVFNDDVDPNLIDDGVGVGWDDRLAAGLAPGEHAVYSIIDRAEVPTDMNIQRAPQTDAVQRPPTRPRVPLPDSGYRTESVRASADGAITIVFIPAQAGTATIEVAAPTASVSGTASLAAHRRCKRDQVELRGRCRARSTPSGALRARGSAAVPLRLTVAPSHRVRAALSKGRRLTLSATLSYQSALGGKPAVRTFHLSVKPPRHRQHPVHNR